MTIEITNRFTGAILYCSGCATLREAVIECLKTKGANLGGADLGGANLGGADLVGAKSGSVCRMDFGGWSICIREDKTTIGCQCQANSDWLQWTPKSKEIVAMHDEASAWWEAHGPAIKASIRVVMKKAKKTEGKK